MDQTRERLKELWRLGQEVPQESRLEWLERVCADEPEMRAELRSLWEAERESGGFLLRPALEGMPARMGVWQPVRKLGSGGMGVVYEAVRVADGIEQRAALKMIDRAKTGTATLRRFQQERQILAKLDHPAIARLLDGGQDDEGQPFLVMEYVDGVALDVWARQGSLDEKLVLFERICAGVQYAHQHLVVHRDLKPANILVRDDGSPKLLDFGIAKFLPEQDGSATVMFLTPDFASPEQKRGESATTASDIYSLGVLLKGLAGEADKDLSSILSKATHEDAQDRYGSAAALGEDVARYRAGMPVLARPLSTTDALFKFVRRNRVTTGLGFAALLAVLVSAAIAWYQRNQAQEMFRTSRAIAGRMIWDVEAALRLETPTAARAKLLEQTVRYLDELAKSRVMDEDMRLELSESYRRLGRAYLDAAGGDGLKAVAAHERALGLLTGDDKAMHFLRGKVEIGMTQALMRVNQMDEAETHARRAVQLWDAAASDANANWETRHNRLSAHIVLGDLIASRKDLTQLEQLRVEAVRQAAALDTARPEAGVLRAQAEKRLAAVLWVQKKYAEALPHEEAAMKLDEAEYRRQPGADQRRNFATSLSEMGGLYLSWGKTELALPYVEQALELRRAAVAEDPGNRMGRFGLANILLRKMNALLALHKWQEANAALDEAGQVAAGPPADAGMLKRVEEERGRLAQARK